MKKFYTVNFPESDSKVELLTEMVEALLLGGISTEDINSSDIIIDVGNGSSVSHKLIVNNKELDLDGSYFWFRGNGKSRRFISVLASFLDSRTIPFSDPVRVHGTKAHSKPMQAVRLSAANLPIPHTLIMTPDSLEANKEYIEKHVQFPVVMKADGAQGRNVWKVKSIEEIKDRIGQEHDARVEVFILQDVVQGAGSDIRAMFFKGKLIGAIRRTGDGFLNNYKQGGAVEQYMLTDVDMDICRRAKAVSMLDYIGVDFMHDSNGRPVVIELQNGPGSTAMRKVHPKLNIGKSIINSLT